VAIDVTLRADISHAMVRWKVHVKDLPGSPITDQGLFPVNEIVWELNYRGELGFMYQARAQSETRKIRVEDGWLYFLHGWTQESLKSITKRSGVSGLIGSPRLRERLPDETIYPCA
jgi:shikimate 5-dehydrogenase